MPNLYAPKQHRWFSTAVAAGLALATLATFGTSPLSALDRATVERPLRSERPLPSGVVFPKLKSSATDPAGDTLGITQPQIDFSFLSAQVFGSNLVIDLQFTGSITHPTSGLPNAIDGFVDIDADQNGNTGREPWVDSLTGSSTTGMGNEYYLDLLTYESGDGAVDLVEEPGETTVGRCPTSFSGTSLRVEIPLALLGGDTEVDVAAAIGTRTELPTDVVPNSGSVSSLPDSGSAVFLRNGRFRVEVEWRNFEGETGLAKPVFRSDESAVLYFFIPDNWEVLVKVIDGCTFNDRFWIFSSASTNVEYTLTVTDTQNGASWQYFNPLGQASEAITDTDAFATCP